MASRAPENASGEYPYHKLNETMFHRRTAQSCATHLLPCIQPNHRILDIGCGPGSITVGFAKLVPDGEVVGIDIDVDSIESATAAAKERGISNVTFKFGDARKDLAGIATESFDIVHAHQVLLHLPEPRKVIEEMRRITKVGGIVTTRDCFRQFPIPPIPGMVKNLEMFYAFTKSQGGDFQIGQRHHLIAHEAGFPWEDIEMSCWGADEAIGNREGIAQGAKDSTQKGFIAAGLLTQEECDEQSRAWDEWSQLPEARLMMLDSALICWKRNRAP